MLRLGGYGADVSSAAAGAPRCFISHSSKDKDRFVLPLATRLDAGVDAWLDKWGLGVGDNLITKIYDEGIGQADYVIVVISANSMASRWVKDEMEVSKVREIEGTTRLLPIVLDGSSVPVALSAKRHLRIEDPTSFDEQFSELVQVIFNVERAPALGNPPAWSSFELPGLRPTDAVVLAAACECAGARAAGATGSGPIYGTPLARCDERSVRAMTALEHDGLSAFRRPTADRLRCPDVARAAGIHQPDRPRRRRQATACPRPTRQPCTRRDHGRAVVSRRRSGRPARSRPGVSAAVRRPRATHNRRCVGRHADDPLDLIPSRSVPRLAGARAFGTPAASGLRSVTDTCGRRAARLTFGDRSATSPADCADAAWRMATPAGARACEATASASHTLNAGAADRVMAERASSRSVDTSESRTRDRQSVEDLPAAGRRST